MFIGFVLSNIGHIRPHRTILAFASGIFFILSGTVCFSITWSSPYCSPAPLCPTVSAQAFLWWWVSYFTSPASMMRCWIEVKVMRSILATDTAGPLPLLLSPSYWHRYMSALLLCSFLDDFPLIGIKIVELKSELNSIFSSLRKSEKKTKTEWNIGTGICLYCKRNLFSLFVLFCSECRRHVSLPVH